MITRTFFAIAILITASVATAGTVGLNEADVNGGSQVQLFITDIGAFSFDTVNIETTLTAGTALNPSPTAIFGPLVDQTGVNGQATVAQGLAVLGLNASSDGLDAIISSTTGGIFTDTVLAGQSANPLAQIFGTTDLAGTIDVTFAAAGQVVDTQSVAFGAPIMMGDEVSPADGTVFDLSFDIPNLLDAVTAVSGTIAGAEFSDNALGIFTIANDDTGVDLGLNPNFDFSSIPGQIATEAFVVTTGDGSTFNFSVTAGVPEPTSLALLGLGVAGVFVRRRV